VAEARGLATPQRTILCATFSNGIGEISIRELMDMPEERWGFLRDRITDHNNGRTGYTARCCACDSRVFIKSSIHGDTRRPLYSHYRGGDKNCIWYHGPTDDPNRIRANQYNGQQESFEHFQMCKLLSSVIQLDKRYISHKIEKYLPPTDNEFGRYPDLYVEWDQCKPFVIEFQLSNTFQTEISQRCIHYERENIPLLWILSEFKITGNIPQNFRDVIRRHRDNAFVFDEDAFQASRDQKTLILKCMIKNGENFLTPKLVRYDELTIPTSNIPFYEDRIIPPLNAKIKARRKPWFNALEMWNQKDYNDTRLKSAIKSLPLNCQDADPLLIAAIFSIICRAKGIEKNFASRHSTIDAMLNGRLNGKAFARYSDLIEFTLKRTHVSTKPSVAHHLHRLDVPQADIINSPEGRALRHLIPEIFDPLIREELLYYEALPGWAL
jgi:hypothetical protein